ncbi:MAG: flagellar basal-body MS-ring/collar protein FliF [Paracoccaceae bacterium]|nr:flagellar basal-body MS-ring/collar protein FliF [Paracoccaceae bacterium]
MQQLLAVWTSLSVQKRIVVALATVAMFAAVLMLSRAATTPSMALLYSGLEAAAAGDVVAALEARSAAYEVRGGAIYVDGALRDELRMTLAAEGLPATGGAGYELLDSLSGFGTTSQMFDAAYWRAKEGELARTIAASPAIRSARVHIASAANQGFRRDLRPTASVALVPAGQGVSREQARAVRFLVASAVAGLGPESVSVIDAESGLVLGGDEDGAVPAGDPDRAAALKRNVERLLEARVGAGRAIVELSIDTATEREQITERIFDPDTRVAISTESEERSGQSNDSRPGAVTVASNLPAGDAAAGDGRSSSQNSETRERVNYEVSETQREVLRAPGAVKRITVAVLVDGVRTTDASGAESWQARPEEELAALRELAASAVGFDEARGDVITIKSMPFEAAALVGTEAGGAVFGGIDPMSAAQLGVLAVVALILGLFVVRPILAPREAPALAGPARPELSAPGGGGAPMEIGPPLPGIEGGAEGSAPVFTGEIDDDNDFFAGGFPQVNPSLPALRGKSGGAEANFDPNDPVARLRRLIAERQDETAEILRSWMDDREEKV